MDKASKGRAGELSKAKSEERQKIMTQLEMELATPFKRATNKYIEILNSKNANKHISQNDRIFAQLYNAYTKNEAVPLTDLLMTASHTARMSELRSGGWDIECRTWKVDGQTHSEYRIVL